MRFFLRLFYMFHLRYSNCRPLNSARYNRIICQTVENTSFFERLSCILHALAKGYQGYKSNFGFHVPFDREIWQILDQKSVFGFTERNTPQMFTNFFDTVQSLNTIFFRAKQQTYFKIYSVKTKSTVSVHSPMWRWSLLKTGPCVWLEVASIFRSLGLEKTPQMPKKLVEMISCRYVCYHLSKELLRVLLAKTSRISTSRLSSSYLSTELDLCAELEVFIRIDYE